MNTYAISYITNSGIPVFNHLEDGRTSTEAIQEVKGSEGVTMILSCIKIK